MAKGSINSSPALLRWPNLITAQLPRGVDDTPENEKRKRRGLLLAVPNTTPADAVFYAKLKAAMDEVALDKFGRTVADMIKADSRFNPGVK